MTNGVYSEFALEEMGIKFKSSDSYQAANCVGSCEEEMEVRVVSKKCRGVVAKETVKGTGKGTLKLSMHMPYDIYTQAYGMNLDTLIEGVKAYGQNSRHEAFAITQHVYDEDGVEMLKAYPNCIIKTGKANKIENGVEEVAEIELEVSVMPDDFGNGVYSVIVDELKDDTVKTTWMTAFKPEMVRVAEA